ncbi:MAG: 3-oxochol-4-en-24-oyl-CoA dehydrogenase [Pseudonocardiales bacterium]|nr:3-oxochol-4-en-24-oyl-CoA dehydrogenase [Pseudonocardiales bacterium]
MPIAISDDQRCVADTVRAWARQAAPVASARSQESAPDAWRKHWGDLAGLGIFAVAVPEQAGGAGGTLVDLAVMVEAAAQAMVPGPVASTAVAAVLLAGRAQHRDLVAGLVDGTSTAAVALAPDGLTAARAGEDLLVSGTTAPVTGADAEGLLVLAARLGARDVWFVADAGEAGIDLSETVPADFSRSLATVRLDGVRVTPERVLDTSTAAVRDLSLMLAAAEAGGVAAWCLHTATEYAKVREQFGRPVGSFQAIKHLCAEMLCRSEQITALAWDAAQAAGDAEHREVTAAMAGALVLDAAVETAKDAIQVLGGIGFTWEHDAHLYLRRAVANRQLFGGSAPWRRRAAELTLAGARRELHIDLGAEVGRHRDAVRTRVAAIAAEPPERRRTALAEAGYLAPHWPAPYGLGAGAAEQLLIDQELAAAGLDRPDLVIAGWAIPTILQAGTPEQQARFVAPTLRGELVWCQLFSEPGAGSDLASLRTRATRVDGGGGWRLSGQKVWTSMAHAADWGICLARTNPDAPKHKGISYFLVDMKSAGLQIRPLREITGEAMFNEVFLDDVFVPDDLVVGAVDDGWRLARATLANERIAMSGGAGIDDELEAVLALAEQLGHAEDELVLQTLGELAAVSVSGALLGVRATLRQLAGGRHGDNGAEASVRKLIGVRHRQAVAEAGLSLLGTAGAAAGPQWQQFLTTRCLTIAGGTTQVLLTLAAERILGLPRS